MAEFSNIFDAHAHYDDAKFDCDRDELLGSMSGSGVCGIVNASVDIDSSRISLGYAHIYDFMYAAVGVHPENMDGLSPDYLDTLSSLYSDKRAVAIGEIGLDYHWDIPKDRQQKIFTEQLRLASDLNAPVVIHDREAHADTVEQLKKYRPHALLHCYSGSAEMLTELLPLGIYISLGGVVTFKNSRHSVQVAETVPLDRLLLETDAPYLSPEPLRSKRNDSKSIVHTASRIAQLRGITTQQLLDITAENAYSFYRIG